MGIIEWVRFMIGTVVLLCGLSIFIVEIFGIFHMKYVLNRMHAAAMGDTLGISISLVGLKFYHVENGSYCYFPMAGFSGFLPSDSQTGSIDK